MAALFALLHLEKLFLTKRLKILKSKLSIVDEKTEAALRHYTYYPSYF